MRRARLTPIPRPLSRQDFARQPCARDPLLDEVIAAIDRAPIVEAPIHADGRFVFGDCDREDGSIVLNIALVRVLLYLHEGLHRIRPELPERTVRAISLRMLHALTDQEIADLDRDLRAACRRATRSRSGPTSR